MISRSLWHTVEIKIDYVDFVVAKNFLHVIQAWAEGLEKTPEDKSAKRILSSLKHIGDIAPQFGRLGACAFLISYVIFAVSVTLKDSILAIAISGIIWGLTEWTRRASYRMISKTARKNIIPSVIIVSSHDDRLYNEISSNCGPSTLKRLFQFGLISILNIVLNILASYIFVSFYTEI